MSLNRRNQPISLPISKQATTQITIAIDFLTITIQEPLTHMGVFEANADELQKLHQRVHEEFRRRSESSERMAAWTEAARCFHESYDRLAFPGGIAREFELLKAGDPTAIEMAVRFLEADPWYFRSGYHKANFLRLLRKQALSDDQCARLRHVILKHVHGRPLREVRAYCRFAPKVTNAAFEEAVMSLVQDSNRRVARAAQWILHCLKRENLTTCVTVDSPFHFRSYQHAVRY